MLRNCRLLRHVRMFDASTRRALDVRLAAARASSSAAHRELRAAGKSVDFARSQKTFYQLKQEQLRPEIDTVDVIH
jgi:hypothetical protein